MTIKKDYFIHASSYVEPSAKIGIDTKIWHFCHIDADAKIGEQCSLGQNVYVGKGVTVGKGVKIQNNVSVYSGVTLEDNVFCGPSVVFTNDLNPRSEFSKNGIYDKTLVKTGATLGANATIVCGNIIGEYAFVGAGALISKDVPAYSIQVGVPSEHIGWMCQCGEKLPSNLQCQKCNRNYQKTKTSIKQVNLGI